MFTVCIVIHLFALAVYYKNLQRLEPFYVASSLLIPMIVTAVILPIRVVNEHHVISIKVCFIQDIMYTITFAVLVLTSWLIVITGTVLCYRACQRRNLVLSEYDKQHKKALCEMLPLLLYPILFLLLTVPILAISIDDFRAGKIYYWPSNGLMFSVCAPIWNLSTSMFFICHLCVVRHIRKRSLLRIKTALRNNRRQRLRVEEGLVTVSDTTPLFQRSDTHYSAQTED